ncbi:type 2 lanthipeptide synthetase LanM family protein [Streptomyces sp. NPDC001922]|uniref:type 2 lanthipeptide synthetase LanM family protein n=1 Tax=Streptomyces sp. NPDC001922 TaxID=3364624 RepID=UPI0036CF51A8
MAEFEADQASVTASWPAACTIAERLTGGAPGAPAETAAADARLAQWGRLAAFRGTPERFAERLRPVGVDVETLHRLLGESPRAVADRTGIRPDWVGRLVSARTQGTPDTTGTPPLAGFLRVAEPLVRQARDRLRRSLRQRGAEPPELSGLHEVLCGSLPLDRLGVALTPALVLEVNAARVEGRLTGDDARERFDAFVHGLGERAVQDRFWAEYPVLARHVVDLLDRWAEDRERFARHLHEDLPELSRVLPAGVRLTGVEEVAFGRGDTHRGGRTVCRVVFRGGAAVMYKPRSLAADVRFGELLSRFNQETRYPLRTPRVLDRTDHGWAEWVRPAACSSEEDVAGFYRRMGATLALLHALKGGDFHYENLIAAGADPVLVDLEALCQPTGADAASWGTGLIAADPAEEALRTSVRATSLLPARIVLDPAAKTLRAADVSGMSGAAGQPSAVPVPVEKGGGTDEIRLVHEHVAMPGADNRPRLLDGSFADPADHVAPLLEGFRHGYGWVCDHREELLAADGPVARFADVPVRCVPRASFVYAKLMSESFHPDFLRDALDRELGTARLCSGWEGVPGRATVIRSEMDAVLRGDIPLFQVLPGSRALILDSGEKLADVLPEPPLADVRRRIETMGPADLALQERVITGSFVSGADISTLEAPRLSPGRRSTGRGGRVAEPDELVEAAVTLGDQVCRLAVADGDRIGWIAPRAVAPTAWDLGALNTDLYAGLSGIGLFLARLGRCSGQQRFTDTAVRVADEVIRRTLADPALAGRSDLDTGAFGAYLGPLYFLSHLDRMLGGTPRTAALLDPVLAAVGRSLDASEEFDVVGGSAGCALVLAALGPASDDGAVRKLAARVADHLLAGAAQDGDAYTWNHPRIESERPLTGFAHGASGIATALGRLHPLLPERGCAAAAVGALAYETAVQDAASGNWPDFRSDVPSRFRSLWCHGAAGIGMARLDLLDRPGFAALRKQLLADAVAALGPSDGGADAHRLLDRGSDSMCHGDLGNLELLLLAGEHGLCAPDAVLRAVAGKLDAAAASGWICGSPTRAETPSLLTGLSGVGYQLLRFARPESVPSVLLVHPPQPG